MHRLRRLARLTVILGLFGQLMTLFLSAAETPNGKGNWKSLETLAPGEQIQIVLNDAKSYRGQFQTVSEEAIVVRIATGEEAFQKERVVRVSTIGKSHRGRNALIGAAIGGGLAGLAVGIDASQHRAGQVDVPGAIAVGIPFSAGLGAGIGAIVPTGGWHAVYRAP